MISMDGYVNGPNDDSRVKIVSDPFRKAITIKFSLLSCVYKCISLTFMSQYLERSSFLYF